MALRLHPVSARIVTGSLSLARELAVEHGYALIEGRNPSNCERHDVVQALGRNGHDVEALACGTEAAPRCPFRDRCSYYAQFQQARPRVGAAEQLFNRHFLAGGSLVVVNDADLMRSLVSRTSVALEDLASARDRLTGKRRAGLRSFLSILGLAILSAPVREDGASMPLIGAAVWDHLVRTGRLHGEDFVALLASLPRQPSLPPPTAGEEGYLTREAVEDAPPPVLLDCLIALREEVPFFLEGEDFNSRFRLTQDGLQLWRLKEHVRDRFGAPLVAGLDMLILDATPVEALVDHLTQHHKRLPDVRAEVRLSENVRVRQYATSTNGHVVLRDPSRVSAVLSEVEAERRRAPARMPQTEGAVCFRSLRNALIDAGFAESQVVTFGNVRGTNALAGVERLHVIGRPTPPVDELPYLAQVIHCGQRFVSGRVVLRPQAFGGQPYEVDVLDYGEPCLSALLRASREDEIIQAIHRGRLLSLAEPQLQLVGESGPVQRRQVELILHTSQPVPGLRVDELILKSELKSMNEERHDSAERRIRAAVLQLEENCEPVTVSAVVRLVGGSRTTVTKALREGVHTPKEDLSYKGVYTLHEEEEGESVPIVPPGQKSPGAEPNLCRGGCGKEMPPGQMCMACAIRETEAWARTRGRGRTA
jgi:hypothetical protein